MIVLAAVLACGSAQAVEWFTILGDKEDTGVDTAQLDVSTVGRRGTMMELRFRVNLAAPRTLADGEVYQSYISHIVVECDTRSIFHEDQERFQEPLWQGPTHSEKFVQPRPMAFGGLVPDPRPRILLAACQPRQ